MTSSIRQPPGVLILVRLAGPVLVLMLPILLLTTALRIEMNSMGLYMRGFQEYAVTDSTSLSESQLHDAAMALIRYFNSFSDSPQMSVVDAHGRQFELYHDYEIIHLEDVKELFALNSVLQAVSLLLVVLMAAAGLSLGHRRAVCQGLRNGSLLTLVLLSATGLAFIADFQSMFVAFHLVAFDNPFWQLNPLTDYLIMLFPLGFWQDMAMFAGAATGVMAIVLFVLATRWIRTAQLAGDSGERPAPTGRDV